MALTKKIFVAILALTLIAVSVLPAAAVDPLIVETYKGTAVVDGKKDEIYNRVPSYKIENFTSGSTANTTGVVYTLWDGNTLYFYIESYDTTPWTGDIIEAHICDCIELFIDLNNKRGDDFNYDDASYVQLRVNNRNEITGNNTGDQWILQPEVTDNVKTAVGYLNGKDLSEGYAIEVSFDVSAFTTLSEGKEMAFDIQLADVQDDNTVRAVQAFLGNNEKELLDTQWNTPKNCGATIVLKGPAPEPEPEPVPEPETAANEPTTPSPATSDSTLQFALFVLAITLSLAAVYYKKFGKYINKV